MLPLINGGFVCRNSLSQLNVVRNLHNVYKFNELNRHVAKIAPIQLVSHQQFSTSSPKLGIKEWQYSWGPQRENSISVRMNVSDEFQREVINKTFYTREWFWHPHPQHRVRLVNGSNLHRVGITAAVIVGAIVAIKLAVGLLALMATPLVIAAILTAIFGLPVALLSILVLKLFGVW